MRDFRPASGAGGEGKKIAPSDHGGEKFAREEGVNQKFKPRLLLVDDDADFCTLIQRVLAATGHYTVMVETEATRAVAAARIFRPDLIILDVMMPGIRGDEIAREIREEAWLRYRPIILLSGMAESFANVESTMGDGPSRFVSKVLGPAGLVDAIDALLNAAQISDSLRSASPSPLIGPRTAAWPLSDAQN